VSTLAVYDCMLFFQAADRPQRFYATFELVHKGSVVLCLSPDVLAEIRDVVTRPKLRRKFPALTPQAVDAFVSRYLRRANWIVDVPGVYTVQRDPKDSKYVNLALAAAAPYLVTQDKDLLDLMKTDTPEGSEFCRRFANLKIVDPVTFLRELGNLRK